MSSSKIGERPDRSHTQQRKQHAQKAGAAVKAPSLSDNKIGVIQNAMVFIAVLMAITQSGFGRFIGAGFGSWFDHPQLEGQIDATLFWAPYLAILFVYFMLYFMKSK